MREFPEKFQPIFLPQFSTFRFDRVQCYLRQDIYEHVLKGDSEDPFDLEIFRVKYELKKEDLNKMVENLTKEMTIKKWGVSKGLGGTTLYVFDPSKPPATASWG